MTPDEVAAFRAHPLAGAAIAVRRAGEAAKVVGREVPGLPTWAPRLRAYAGQALGSPSDGSPIERDF